MTEIYGLTTVEGVEGEEERKKEGVLKARRGEERIWLDIGSLSFC